MKKKTLIEALQAVADFFEGNEDKFVAWLIVSNPNLGDISPVEMIQRGRVKKLCDLIETWRKE